MSRPDSGVGAPRWIFIVALASLLAVVAEPGPFGGRADEHRSWPIRAEYDIDATGFPGGTASFVLEAGSWFGWRQVQTCCGEDTGLVMELHPDGTVWVGLAGTPLVHVNSIGPSHGMVPQPEFGPRYPTDPEELRATEGLDILADGDRGTDVGGALASLRAVAATLGLDAGTSSRTGSLGRWRPMAHRRCSRPCAPSSCR